MKTRLSKEAEADLDEIWLYVARSSGSMETADRVIDQITAAFWLLARHPYAGRSRDAELRPGLRSVVADDYVVIYRIEGESPLVLHVFHGKRDIEAAL